ncbi:MAG: hypothetical protein KBA54_03825, partial [Candidatus Cloacimonetes bacterium]|nr:hypothetical protein [Candidatus Cloacimonadota bacterium]
MKKTILVILTLSLALGLGFAKDLLPATTLKVLPTSIEKKTPVDPDNAFPVVQSRVAPQYSFTKLPTAIITNYYDYMIGSYNGLPLRVIPDVAGGGYFMTYHGRRQPTSTRRAFYTYLDASGNVINNNEVTSVQ